MSNNWPSLQSFVADCKLIKIYGSVIFSSSLDDLKASFVTLPCKYQLAVPILSVQTLLILLSSREILCFPGAEVDWFFFTRMSFSVLHMLLPDLHMCADYNLVILYIAKYNLMLWISKDCSGFRVGLAKRGGRCPFRPSLEGGVILCPWKSSFTQKCFKSNFVLNCLNYWHVPMLQNWPLLIMMLLSFECV